MKTSKITSLFLAFSLVLSCSFFSASASVQSGTMSAAEFYAALKEEYRKCGLTLEVDIPDDSILYTIDMLEKESQLAQRISNGITITIDPAENVSAETTDIQPNRVMPSDFSYSRTVTVNCNELPVVGIFKFKVDIAGVVDLQNNVLISVNTCKVRHVSSTNVESYDLDIDYSVYSNYSIQYSVTGEITYSWVEPNTNVTFRVTKDGLFAAANFKPWEYI